MEHKKPKRPAPNGPQAFDVFRPNKVRTHANSRPVIVSNRPEQADPMVKEESKKAQPEFPAPEATPTTAPEVPANELPKDVLQEQEQISALAEAAVAAEPAKKPELASDEDDGALPAIDSEGQQVMLEARATPDATEPIKTQSSELESQPEQDTAPVEERAHEKPAEQPTPQRAMSQAEDDELLSWEGIESAATQAPTVSIHHHRKSKGRRALSWLLGILLFLGLGVVALDIVLDAGMWIPNFEVPHTHIIQHYRDSRVVE